MAGNDYLIEKRLYQLNPELHNRVSASLFVLQKLLSDYLIYFPEFTDHAETHSIAIIDYCNKFIGSVRNLKSRFHTTIIYKRRAP